MLTRHVLSAGHELIDRAGDVAIEAWGADAASCLREALVALVESFAGVGEPPATSLRPLATGPCGAEDALVSLLEEVIFNLDVASEVPVRFHLEPTEEGGFAGDMEVVPLARVEIVGPAPKAVSYHGLEMKEAPEGWRCHVLIDV